MNNFSSPDHLQLWSKILRILTITQTCMGKERSTWPTTAGLINSVHCITREWKRMQHEPCRTIVLLLQWRQRKFTQMSYLLCHEHLQIFSCSLWSIVLDLWNHLFFNVLWFCPDVHSTFKITRLQASWIFNRVAPLLRSLQIAKLPLFSFRFNDLRSKLPMNPSFMLSYCYWEIFFQIFSLNLS